mmetsp:Transcript_11976/g.32333  ORF Transcript_11976/g.32333 Transcript_11976/m.32333 type:complete len:205 (+) Transcript_11976:443-1057(+)
MRPHPSGLLAILRVVDADVPSVEHRALQILHGRGRALDAHGVDEAVALLHDDLAHLDVLRERGLDLLARRPRTEGRDVQVARRLVRVGLGLARRHLTVAAAHVAAAAARRDVGRLAGVGVAARGHPLRRGHVERAASALAAATLHLLDLRLQLRVRVVADVQRSLGRGQRVRLVVRRHGRADEVRDVPRVERHVEGHHGGLHGD